VLELFVDVDLGNGYCSRLQTHEVHELLDSMPPAAGSALELEWITCGMLPAEAWLREARLAELRRLALLPVVGRIARAAEQLDTEQRQA
jgi:hypothetical protein